MSKDTDGYSAYQTPPKPYGPAAQARPVQAHLTMQNPLGYIKRSAEYDKTYFMLGEFLTGLITTNHRYPTVQRTNWSRELTKIFAVIGAPGDRSDVELKEIQKAILDLKQAFQKDYVEAVDYFHNLVEEYELEVADLESSVLFSDVYVLQVLKKEFEKLDLRALYCESYLVQEDLIEFDSVLAKGHHIIQGERLASKELQKIKAAEEDILGIMDGDEPEEPSLAGMAWDVVGWDSPGDFASDVLLTIFTGGIAKGVKAAVKLKRAKKKLDKIKILAELRKARKIQKISKIKIGLEAAITSLRGIYRINVSDVVRWSKKEWLQVGQKYVSDVFGSKLGGSDQTENKTILERLSAEKVKAYVNYVIKADSKREKNLMRVFLALKIAKKTGMADKFLHEYIKQNFKRRLFENIVYYGIKYKSEGKEVFSTEFVFSITSNTITIMTQDLVSNVYNLGQLTDFLLEVGRKSIQTAVTDWLKFDLSQ